jgi:hypothetical protein
MRYLIKCKDCESRSESDWIAKATSDADWHNTMTGHRSYVEAGRRTYSDDAEPGSVVYDNEEDNQ